MAVQWGDMTRGTFPPIYTQKELANLWSAKLKARRKKRTLERAWTAEEVYAYLRLLRGPLPTR